MQEDLEMEKEEITCSFEVKKNGINTIKTTPWPIVESARLKQSTLHFEDRAIVRF